MNNNSNNTAAASLAFVGDHLAVTDEAAAKTHRDQLSPSTANAIASCPARYAAERILPRADDPHSPAQLGTYAHTVLEQLYGLPAAQRTEPAAEQFATTIATDTANTDPGRLNAQIWERTAGIFTLEDPTRTLVHRTEWHITGVSVAAIPFRGIIDRADITGDDRAAGISLTDYKTGAPQYANSNYGDPHGDQLRLYTLAAAELTGHMPLNARIAYTRHGKQRYVPLTKDDIAATTTAFAAAWDQLRRHVDNQTFPTRPSKLCGWCPLATSCPSADPDLTPQVEQVPVQHAAGEHARAGATHTDNNNSSIGTIQGGDTTMTLFTDNEPKPWDAADHNGQLNPNSYAAIGAFGTVSLAVDKIDTHNATAAIDDQVAVTKGNVTALAETFAAILADVQKTLSSSDDPQHGLNTRLRGALHTVLDTHPVPFGGTEDDWRAWTEAISRRLESTAHLAADLWANVTDGELSTANEPWSRLAADNQTAQQDAA